MNETGKNAEKVRYNKENTKLITLRVKNSVAADIDAYCKAQGESKQGLILRLLFADMAAHGWKPGETREPGEPGEQE